MAERASARSAGPWETREKQTGHPSHLPSIFQVAAKACRVGVSGLPLSWPRIYQFIHFLRTTGSQKHFSNPKTNLENNKTLTFHESIFAVVFWHGRGHTEEKEGKEPAWQSQRTPPPPLPCLSHFPGSFQKRNSFLFRNKIQRQLWIHSEGTVQKRQATI